MTVNDMVIAFYRAFVSPAKPKRSFSQFAEDLLIQNMVNVKTPGFYVDVGCHHPRRGSNTYSLYRRGWHGILIDLEPCKVLANRLARRRDHVVLAAVSDKEEEVTIYSDKSYSTNTTISGRLGNQYHSLGTIRTRTLTSILVEANTATKFDLLAIDVEGMDFQALKGLNLNTYRPKIICIENWRASDGVQAILNSEIHTHLADNAYELAGWSGLSTIYRVSC